MIKLCNEIKDLRRFGSVLGLIFIILGTINFLKGQILWYPWFFGLAVIIISFVILCPMRIKPIFIIFSKVGHAIGWINTRILLILIYFIFVTPIAFVMKIFGKDLLNRKIDKSATSYWTRRTITKPGKSELEKQF